jgi:hypothetical protein
MPDNTYGPIEDMLVSGRNVNPDNEVVGNNEVGQAFL